ncbi:hypothetical protein V8F06_000848 [Rhypophila decipiens]
MPTRSPKIRTYDDHPKTLDAMIQPSFKQVSGTVDHGINARCLPRNLVHRRLKKGYICGAARFDMPQGRQGSLSPMFLSWLNCAISIKCVVMVVMWCDGVAAYYTACWFGHGFLLFIFIFIEIAILAHSHHV